MCCLHVYMCTACMLGISGGRRRALDPLGLELQMVVNHRVGARTSPGPLEEQPVLLFAEPSVQPSYLLFNLDGLNVQLAFVAWACVGYLMAPWLLISNCTTKENDLLVQHLLTSNSPFGRGGTSCPAIHDEMSRGSVRSHKGLVQVVTLPWVHESNCVMSRCLSTARVPNPWVLQRKGIYYLLHF